MFIHQPITSESYNYKKPPELGLHVTNLAHCIQFRSERLRMLLVFLHPQQLVRQKFGKLHRVGFRHVRYLRKTVIFLQKKLIENDDSSGSGNGRKVGGT